MDCGATISTIGLALDILGVVVLFYFGLPKRIALDMVSSRPFRVEGREFSQEEEAEDRRIEARQRRNRRINHVGAASGLAILAIGFSLQILGIWV